MLTVDRQEKTAYGLAASGGFFSSIDQPQTRKQEVCMLSIPNNENLSISKIDALTSDIANGITRSQNSQTISKPIDMLKAALWYARRGWQIFPLRPRTKEPFGGIGVYAATTDADQIRAWWQRWPQANIGLHCGGSGILGLDADVYKESYEGTPLTQAEQETVTGLSGKGGAHLYYVMPEGMRFGNATGGLPPGIDIRGYGGYFVLPPSVHPNGNRYRWELGYGPHEIPMLPVPSSLFEILRKTAHRAGGAVETAHPAAIRQAVALVERVLTALDIAATGPLAYMTDGRRWALGTCPFMPADDPHDDDRGPFVIVHVDGRIVAGCQHNRCRQEIERSGMSGWRLLRARSGVGSGAWHDAAIDALLASLSEVA